MAVKPAAEPASAPELATQKPPGVEKGSESALAGAFSAAVQATGADLDPAAGEEWFVGINGVPVGPIKLSELRSKAATGSVTRESLVWRDGFEEWKPLGTFPELVAIVEESTSGPQASGEPLTDDATMLAIATAAAPRVEIAPVQPSSATTDDTDELEQLAGLKRSGGLSVPQVFAMVVAILFGLTVGFVMFSGTEKTKEVVKYVKVPSEAEQSGTQPERAPAETEGETAEEEETGKKANRAPATGTRVATANKTSSATSDQQGGLKGLSGLSGLAAGPSRGPAGNQAANSNSGRPLDSASVQSTVSRYTGSVKRSCWQPALDTRDPNAPTSARVVVTITVGSSGSVQNVGTSGDPKGYRGLATCIARRVRGWQFPASSGTTTVNVPFVFAAQ